MVRHQADQAGVPNTVLVARIDGIKNTASNARSAELVFAAREATDSYEENFVFGT
jgi:hypothetical protein